MTETDKIEIDNLLNSVKEMRDYARKTNETYVDDKIVDFATKAKEDYIGNRDYIVNLIQRNLNLFFDLDNLAVSTSGLNCDGYNARDGKKFCLRLGAGLTLVCRMVDANIIKNTGYDIYFKVRIMEVLDIYYYTSDTDDSRYKTCSAWDLVVSPHDEVVKIPFSTPKNVSGWNKLYCLSTWTRVKNVLLVRQFKELMKEKVEKFRTAANANERKTAEIKGFKMTYVKVDL